MAAHAATQRRKLDGGSGESEGNVRGATYAKEESRDYFFPRMASFAAFAILNLTTRLAGILIASPVWGLRPVLAFLFLRTSIPKPGSLNPFLLSL